MKIILNQVMNSKLLLIVICGAVFTAKGQEHLPVPNFKNDISIGYGAEFNHVKNSIQSLEYRRSLNEAWKIKLTVMGNRRFSDFRVLRTSSFSISDTVIMLRFEQMLYNVNQTVHIGVDYSKLENFTIGAQLILGTATATSRLTDQAFIQFEEGEEPGTLWSGYSDELTMAYHSPHESAPSGTLRTGSWTQNTAYLRYIGIGLGMTFEAKWPISNHFEAALQYRPELIYYSLRDYEVAYDRDTYITTDFPNFLSFYHIAHLLFRYKFGSTN